MTTTTKQPTQPTPAEQLWLLKKEQLRATGRATTADLFGFKR